MKIVKFLFVVLIVSCGMRRAGDIKTPDILNKIVLVNGGVYDRCQIGDLIKQISNCRPKVIGVNFLFIDEKTKTCDSLLKTAITDSKNVILSEGFENGTHISSDRIFSDNAMLTGIRGFVKDDDGITAGYLRVTDDNGRWVYSFPFQLALQYDTTSSSKLAAKSPSRLYPFKITHGLEEFQVINDIASITNARNRIEGKIVIIGFLGPGNEDLLSVRLSNNSSGNAYGSVIIANIILDILSDL